MQEKEMAQPRETTSEERPCEPVPLLGLASGLTHRPLLPAQPPGPGPLLPSFPPSLPFLLSVCLGQLEGAPGALPSRGPSLLPLPLPLVPVSADMIMRKVELPITAPLMGALIRL